jgi:putative ABC transport system permease protein
LVALRPINRKLLRDLWRMRGQVLAVAIVAMCGIATYVTMHGTYVALVQAQSTYYAGHRFADIFASLKRAPLTLIPRIREIPGVADAEGRVVFDAVADVPGLDEPATVRLVSVPSVYRSGLNQVEVRRGRYVEAGAQNEALVSEAFAAANALEPGGAIGAIINGRREELRIVGIAISPEYVNEARGDSFPDNRRFGIVWMETRALAGSMGLRDSFNDLVLTLAPRASQPAIIETLDRMLAPYGGLSAYGREYQTSHRFLQDEIAQDRITASVLPAIFLSVAAFLIHSVLLRLTTLQRGQIALMKSFGYGNFAMGLFYLKFALCAVISGSVAGILLGAWLGAGLSTVYANFFRFPRMDYVLTFETAFYAVAIAAVAAAGGALLAIRGVLRLQPAEGMRPEAPARFVPGMLERSGLRRLLPVSVRMLLRDLMRKPVKACLSVLGIALSLSLIMVGQYTFDALDEIIRVYFRTAQRDDVTLAFNELKGIEVIHQVAALPGVLRVEAFRTAPVRLKLRHREKRTAINGLYPGREMRRILDENERPIELPAHGLVLTRHLSAVLDARTGDRITVEFLDAQKRVVELEVVRVVDEMIGTAAYMDARALAGVMQEGERASGAYLAVDPLLRPALYRQLKSTPGVAGVFLRENMLESFLKTVAENLYISTGILILFACAIAAGVIYNAARISLSERAVELASLRILGFSRAAVGRLLLGQQALITLAALPLGCAIGYLFALWLSYLFSTDLFRLPVVISAETFAVSIGVVLAATVLSAALVWKQVQRLDLIEVLKTRE